MQVISGERKSLHPAQGQPAHEVMQQPVLADGVAAESIPYHRRVAGHHLGGDVIVTRHAVRARVLAGIVAARVARALKHEDVVIRSIEPGHAFGVAGLDAPHIAPLGTAFGAHMRSGAPVEPADVLVGSGLGNLRRAAEEIADPGEALAPDVAGVDPVEEAAVRRVIVVRRLGRPHIDEIRVRREAGLDQLQISLDERQHTIGARMVRLSVGAAIHEGGLRLAIGRERHVVIAEVLRVRVEINIVVVRREQRAGVLAGRNQIAELLFCSPLGARRINVRQAVIVSKVLPAS